MLKALRFMNRKSRSTSEVTQILEDSSQRNVRTKIILLGTGDSGKSTVHAQAKYIFRGGFRDEDRFAVKYILMENVLSSMSQLIYGANKIGEEISDPALKSMTDKIIKADKASENGNTIEIVLSVKEEIKTLWRHPFIRNIFDKRNKFFHFDQAQYYLDNADRILIPAYVPTNEDIVNCYSKTLGVSELKFDYDGQLFSLIDTGGQRNERKKWAFITPDTSIIIFVCALNEYDKKLYEEGAVNRMIESLDVFTDAVNSNAFSNTQIILLFNKLDLFKEKIKTKNPKDYCFPDYKDDFDYDKALLYIKNRFLQCNITNKKISIFEGSALDSQFMEIFYRNILKKGSDTL